MFTFSTNLGEGEFENMMRGWGFIEICDAKIYKDRYISFLLFWTNENYSKTWNKAIDSELEILQA